MRTLKKTLCLVLVLSMICSFGLIGANAAFKDQDEITYEEAVDVMTALGVVQGIGDNTFDPQGSFTRAQATKILAYMILGESAAESMPARSDFSDVPAEFWASKYIGFGVQQGYIAGMGDGTFDPDGSLTGYQWAKMLLCALGYDAKIEQFVGIGWEINVAKVALSADVDLFEGNKGADYNAVATREEAVLYAFNTLTRTMVEYSEKGTTVIVGGVEIVQSASEAKNVTDGGKNTFKADASPLTLEFAEKYFEDLSCDPEATDDLGRPATEWNLKGESDPICTAAAEADLIITAKVDDLDDLNDLLKAAGLKKLTAGTDPVDTTLNSISAQDSTTNTTAAQLIALTGNGVIVELFDNEGDDNIADTAVVIAPTFAELTTVTTRNQTSTQGAYTQYTVSGVSGKVFSSVVNEDKDVDTAFITGSVSQGDKVLAYKDGDNNLYIEAVDTISGLYTAISNKNVMTIDGGSYKQAAAIDRTGLNIDKNEKQSFYVDSYGYILGVAEGVEDDSYALILTTDEQSVLNGTKIETKLVVTAVLADGTVETFNADKDAIVSEGQIYTYDTDDDGETTFTSATDAESVTALDPDVAKVSSTLYANSATKFYVVNWEESDDEKEPGYVDGSVPTGTVTVYTGIKNVPEYTSLSNAYALATDDDNSAIATVVFVYDNVDANANDEYVYLTGNYNKTGSDYALEAIVDGELTTITVKNAAAGAIQIDGESKTVADLKGLFKNVDVTSVAVTAEKATDPVTTIRNNGNLLVTDGTTTTTEFPNNAPVYVIDKDNNVDKMTGADVTSTYTVEDDEAIYVNIDTDDNVVIAVYIITQ